MSLDPVQAAAYAGRAAPAEPPAAPATPNRVIGTEVTPIMPPGYTETTTMQADGHITTVTKDASGAVIHTIIATATIQSPETPPVTVSLWA